MSNEQIYEVLIKQGGQIYRYIFKGEFIEYWAEPENQAKLEKSFRERAYLQDYEVLEIRQSEFLDVIYE